MRNLNNFKVVKQDNSTYDLATMNIIVNSFVVSSPSPVHSTATISGKSGYVDLGTVYEGKTISTKITILPYDNYDFALMRNEVFKLFDSREYFWIYPDEEPGKRYRVKSAGNYSLSRTGVVGEFSINFQSDSAYSESILRTLDELSFEKSTLQFGQGLIAENLIYSHSTTTFSIYNAGDIEIDPRELPLIITFKGVSNTLKITNSTTSDIFQYNGSTVANDILKLNGVKAEKNNLSIFGNTNKKVIKIAKGWNDFIISGNSGSFTIDFDFRFYYL